VFDIELTTGVPDCSVAIKTGKHIPIVKVQDDYHGDEYFLCFYNNKQNKINNFYFIDEDSNDARVIELLSSKLFQSPDSQIVVIQDKQFNQELYECVARKIRAIRRSLRSDVSPTQWHEKLSRLESKVSAMEQLLLGVVNAINTKAAPREHIVRSSRNDFSKNKIAPL
jgi:hypothetical protein